MASVRRCTGGLTTALRRVPLLTDGHRSQFLRTEPLAEPRCFVSLPARPAGRAADCRRRAPRGEIPALGSGSSGRGERARASRATVAAILGAIAIYLCRQMQFSGGTGAFTTTLGTPREDEKKKRTPRDAPVYVQLTWSRAAVAGSLGEAIKSRAPFSGRSHSRGAVPADVTFSDALAMSDCLSLEATTAEIARRLRAVTDAANGMASFSGGRRERVARIEEINREHAEVMCALNIWRQAIGDAPRQPAQTSGKLDCVTQNLEDEEEDAGDVRGSEDAGAFWQSLDAQTIADVKERLVSSSDASGCHRFCKNEKMRIANRPFRINIIAWALEHGSLPGSGTRLQKICDEPRCYACWVLTTQGHGADGATEGDWAYAAYLLKKGSRDENGHRLWTGVVDEYGYGRCGWRGIGWLTHRLAFLVSRPLHDLPDGHNVVRHGNGCPPNCILSRHLSSGTRMDNAADMLRDGTRPAGEKHYRTTLTRADVEEILKTKGVLTQEERAKRFGIARTTVSSIDCGATWGAPGSARRKRKKKKRSEMVAPDYDEWLDILRSKSREVPLAEDDPIRDLGINSPHWIHRGGLTPNGYALVSLDGRQDRAHRYALEAKLRRQLKDGEHARHLCGRGELKSCYSPDHLVAGSAADNAKDAIWHGTIKKGEQHQSARLTDAAVAEIRAASSAGRPNIVLAREYGVNPSSISNIIHKRMRVDSADSM